jgi:methionyl-tRNA formyltransferase
LLNAGHEIPLVLTQPDRPGGRGLKPVESAVKRHAVAQGIPVFQPETLKSDEALARLGASQAQVLIVAAYGLILPRSVLGIFPLGAVNVHASLLPRWRGAAPIQRAILAGDRETGISIMQMDEGLDTGPVLTQEAISILPRDDAGALHDRLAALGGRKIVDALEGLAKGTLEPQPQSAQGATYASKITKADAVLDWRRPAEDLERVVRAFRPTPGASTSLDGHPLKIWRAFVRDGILEPGAVRAADGVLVVGCGRGLLEIQELQRSGGRRLSADEFLRGYRLATDARFA